MTFSPTDRFGQRFTSWYTVEMPAACASEVVRKTTGLPPTEMDPESMAYTPVSALMSVDFPAPFSPMSAWISPDRRKKSTSSRASTPGKAIVMPRISTIVGPDGLGLQMSHLSHLSGVGLPRVGGPDSGPPTRSSTVVQASAVRAQ